MSPGPAGRAGVFEALACGIPLIGSYWGDAEGLFTPGRYYLLEPDRLPGNVHRLGQGPRKMHKMVNASEPTDARRALEVEPALVKAFSRRGSLEGVR